MDAPYALRPYLSVELDRPSHLGKILPQKTKQVKAKNAHQAKTSVKSLNFLKNAPKIYAKFKKFSQIWQNQTLDLAKNFHRSFIVFFAVNAYALGFDFKHFDFAPIF